MQVKSKINRFFGNILRKENVEAEEAHQSELTKSKKKSNKKNNQSYSQWDLMEHIAVDTGKESPIMFEEKSIFSDGLALDSLDVCNEEYYEEPVLETLPKRKSFLKRSSSLLRRSMKRSKRKEVANHSPETLTISPGSVANIVQQINETLLEVAGFSGEVSESSAQIVKSKPLVETSFQKDSNDQCFEDWHHEQDIFMEEKKPGLTNGLKRQASKLVSKFQRTSGSMRLKSANSVDSFPKSTATQKRSASFTSIKGENEPNMTIKRGGSLRRKLSFKVRKPRR
ncbi:unnamed protein product [Orchesella dallaii]|uniref:Uncharacterized protein n=1 Tax=Orchesella dallaii TaxID=48710 RepID=A0ABP1Q327_9HEXA